MFFSAEIAVITNERQDMIKKWREFNNKTKHIDENPNDDKNRGNKRDVFLDFFIKACSSKDYTGQA